MASTTTKIQSTYSYAGANNGSITDQAVDTGATFTRTATTFPAASTNASLTLSFVKANLQSIFIRADQNCTIKTNSSSTPQETITLVAGIAYKWSLSSGLANPFVGNVTAGFVTCTPATTLDIGVLQT